MPMANSKSGNVVSVVLGICIVGLVVAMAWRLFTAGANGLTNQGFAKPGLDGKEIAIPGRPHNILTEVLNPHQIKRRVSFSFSTNSHGLRGKDFSVKKARGTYRIIIVGECVTFGNGVNDHQTYAVLLQQILSKRHPQKTFEVINAGTIAEPPEKILALLKKVSQYSPDLVLFGPGTNTVFMPCHIGREKTRIWLKQKEYDRQMSNFRRVLKDSISISRKHDFRLVWITPTINSFFLPDGRLWVEEQRAMAKEAGLPLVDTAALFIRTEKENGLVFVSGTGKQRLMQYRNGKGTVLKEVSAPAGDNTQYIAPEIYAYLESHTDVGPLLSIDGNHPNPRGHALIAQEIWSVLEAQCHRRGSKGGTAGGNRQPTWCFP